MKVRFCKREVWDFVVCLSVLPFPFYLDNKISALERIGIPGSMSSLSRELVFLILQFLDEEKFKEAVHKYANIFL